MQSLFLPKVRGRMTKQATKVLNGIYVYILAEIEE